MEAKKRVCPFSGETCRDCALYRARHYLYCHPEISREAVCPILKEPEADGAEAPATPWYRASLPSKPPGSIVLFEHH